MATCQYCNRPLDLRSPLCTGCGAAHGLTLQSAPPAGPGVRRSCPRCRRPLEASERHGVEIDYCVQCRGVWLDRGELDKIVEFCGRRGDHGASGREAPLPGLRLGEPEKVGKYLRTLFKALS